MSVLAYYGGKAFYADDIADVLERVCAGRKPKKYVEPFCGWCAVLERVAARGGLGAKALVGSDFNKSVVRFWQGLSRRTWRPPTKPVSKEQWERLKRGPPSALKAFAGVCYSFNGRYFNSYRAPQNPDLSKLQDRADALKKVEFFHRSYDDPAYLAEKGCLFYLDPPYVSRAFDYRHDPTHLPRTGDKRKMVVSSVNGLGKTPFDHRRFWDVARRLAKHNIVVVSEYHAPRDWTCVATLGKKGHKAYHHVNSVSKHKEKLFVWNPAAAPAPVPRPAGARKPM